jgi:hypothetical protein
MSPAGEREVKRSTHQGVSCSIGRPAMPDMSMMKRRRDVAEEAHDDGRWTTQYRLAIKQKRGRRRKNTAPCSCRGTMTDRRNKDIKERMLWVARRREPEGACCCLHYCTLNRRREKEKSLTTLRPRSTSPAQQWTKNRCVAQSLARKTTAKLHICLCFSLKQTEPLIMYCMSEEQKGKKLARFRTASGASLHDTSNKLLRKS